MICSTHVFNAINSIPNVLESTLAYNLVYHTIGAWLTYTIHLVQDHLALLSDAWDASKNAVNSTDLPIGFGTSVGISSLAHIY